MSRATVSSSIEARFCRGCGYSLLHLEGSRCPECGREFDPGDARTYATRRPRGVGRMLRWALGVSLVLAAGYGGVLAWVYWEWRQEREVVLMVVANGAVTQRDVGPGWMRWWVPERCRPWLERVEGVSLNADGFDDESVARLARLRGVESVELVGTGITASGLEPLSRLPKLRELVFTSVPIDDAGLERLQHIRSLRVMSLYGHLASEKGLRRFQEARPDVVLRHEPMRAVEEAY